MQLGKGAWIEPSSAYQADQKTQILGVGVDKVDKVGCTVRKGVWVGVVVWMSKVGIGVGMAAWPTVVGVVVGMGVWRLLAGVGAGVSVVVGVGE